MDARLTDTDVKRVADEVVRRLKKVEQLEFMRPADVQRKLGIKKSYFYRILRESETFPKPVTLPGSRVKVWRKQDVEEWMLKEGRSAD